MKKKLSKIVILVPLFLVTCVVVIAAYDSMKKISKDKKEAESIEQNIESTYEPVAAITPDVDLVNKADELGAIIENLYKSELEGVYDIWVYKLTENCTPTEAEFMKQTFTFNKIEHYTKVNSSYDVSCGTYDTVEGAYNKVLVIVHLEYSSNIDDSIANKDVLVELSLNKNYEICNHTISEMNL